VTTVEYPPLTGAWVLPSWAVVEALAIAKARAARPSFFVRIASRWLRRKGG